MRRFHLTLAALLILSTLAHVPANASHLQKDEKLSAKEEREVRQFAKRFAARLKKTRDLAPYLNKPPASDDLRKAFADPDLAVGMVDKDVISKVGNDELLRFYIALWNIAYLSQTYVYSSFLLQKTPVRDLPPEQQYPAHVVRFMKRDPTIKEWWKNSNSSGSETGVTTVGQFYSVLRTYNGASSLMRTYFRRHPPEATAIYKQNLTYLRNFLNGIEVVTCDSEESCAGLPVGTKTVKINLPVVQLWLVRLNGRLQVLLVGPHDD